MPDTLILASNNAGAGWLTLAIPLGFLIVVLAVVATVTIARR
jgi:hypothetical protein